MNTLKGSLIAIVSSLLIAIIFAFSFRLPIPMGGMLGPFGEINPYTTGNISGVFQAVIMAWVFYGVLGGYIFIALCGGIAGFIAGKKYSGSMFKDRFILLWASIASGAPILFISVLDFVIGAW